MLPGVTRDLTNAINEYSRRWDFGGTRLRWLSRWGLFNSPSAILVGLFYLLPV
jgi:hypothetical protein